LAIVAISTGAFFLLRTPSAGPQLSKAIVAPPTYVGAATCTGCHAAEVNAWKGSHHELSMQHANEQSMHLQAISDSQRRYAC